MKRWEVTFFGNVQGVGFRQTCWQLAQGLPVTGFVQNQPDGSVLLVAEGEAPVLLQLVTTIRFARGQNIERQTERDLPATGQFERFTMADA